MSKKRKKHGMWSPAPPVHPGPPIHPGGRQWETVAVDDGPVYTQRLRVPGGWLYRCFGLWLGHSGNLLSMCFVPLWEEPPDGGWGSI